MPIAQEDKKCSNKTVTWTSGPAWTLPRCLHGASASSTRELPINHLPWVFFQYWWLLFDACIPNSMTHSPQIVLLFERPKRLFISIYLYSALLCTRLWHWVYSHWRGNSFENYLKCEDVQCVYSRYGSLFYIFLVTVILMDSSISSLLILRTYENVQIIPHKRLSLWTTNHLCGYVIFHWFQMWSSYHIFPLYQIYEDFFSFLPKDHAWLYLRSCTSRLQLMPYSCNN